MFVGNLGWFALPVKLQAQDIRADRLVGEFPCDDSALPTGNRRAWPERCDMGIANRPHFGKIQRNRCAWLNTVRVHPVERPQQIDRQRVAIFLEHLQADFPPCRWLRLRASASSLGIGFETGIIVAALTRSLHVLILDDLSCRESPLGWAKIVITAYRSRRADRVTGEVNNGGELVEANIRTVEPNVAFRAVHASRGKRTRAEPVAALYEQGRVHHVGAFPELEDQMTTWVPGDPSPDRMDALVWAITELLIDPEKQTFLALTDIIEISPI